MKQDAPSLFSTNNLPLDRFGLVIVTGLLVGAFTWLTSLLLQHIFVEPVFCNSADFFSACANGGTISIAIALTIINTLGLYGLVRIGVDRPLLVVIAVIVSLAGVHNWVGGFSWYEATAWYGLLFAIAYALFTWIARMTSFAVAATATTLVVVGLRIVMTQL